MAKGFQVIKFVMVEFDDNWITQTANGWVLTRYWATSKYAKLKVVFEGASGFTKTYNFEVPDGEKVNVMDQVIHIPAHCLYEEVGNTVRCEK